MMGDYSDFFQVRGKNKRVFITVKYVSGRVEEHDYVTNPAALRAIDKFNSLPTVKKAKLK